MSVIQVRIQCLLSLLFVSRVISFHRPSSCEIGSYYLDGLSNELALESKWRDCAGWAKCPPGSYCGDDGVRRLCPAGTVGNSSGLTTASCNGMCPAGNYCPAGTANSGVPCGELRDQSALANDGPAQHSTGKGSLFCPEGSSAPSVAQAGYFTTPNGDPASQSGASECPPGSYCPGDGAAWLCPGGRFGAVAGLQTANCSGACAAGFYCPSGSTSKYSHACAHQRPREEQAGVYCPVGSRAPIPTRLGYYAIRAGDPSPSSFLGGHAGEDTAVVALAFNYTTGAPATAGRRAVLKAALAQVLLQRKAGQSAAAGGGGSGEGNEEALVSRFGVVLLRATTAAESGSGGGREAFNGARGDSAVWAVRLEVTSSVSARGFGTAAGWRDHLKRTLKAVGTSDTLAEALGHLPGNNRPALPPSRANATIGTRAASGANATSPSTAAGAATTARDPFKSSAVVDPLSVKAVVAARRTSFGVSAAGTGTERGSSRLSSLSSSLGFDSSDPSQWHDASPLSLSFNISATVAGLDDSVTVLNHTQRQRLRTALVRALGLAETTVDGDDGTGDGTGDEDSGDIGEDDGEASVFGSPRLRNFGVGTARKARKHGRQRGHNGTLLLPPQGGGTWSVEVTWMVELEVSYPFAFSADHSFQHSLTLWDNDEPGPLGWKGNTDGLRDGPASSSAFFSPSSSSSSSSSAALAPGGGLLVEGLATGKGGAAGGLGTGDGTGGGGGGVSSTSRGGDERPRSGVDPFERWASACHSAIAGPRFQRAAVEALALPPVSATPTRVAGPSRVTVDTDSVVARPAAEFGSSTSSSLASSLASSSWLQTDTAAAGINNVGFLGRDYGGFSGGVEVSPLPLSSSSSSFTSLKSSGAREGESGLSTFELLHSLSGGGGYEGQRACPSGSFCVQGVRRLCPDGRYGARESSSDAACDGECSAGYFCPLGSISSTERVCGSKSSSAFYGTNYHRHAGMSTGRRPDNYEEEEEDEKEQAHSGGAGGYSAVFCPRGSRAPLQVRGGWYSYGDASGATERSAVPFAQADANGDGYLDWLEFSGLGPAQAVIADRARRASSGSSAGAQAAVNQLGSALGTASAPTVQVVPGVVFGVDYPPPPPSSLQETASSSSSSSPLSSSFSSSSSQAAFSTAWVPSVEEARALWSLADRDGSGEVTPLEYASYVVNQAVGGARDLSSSFSSSGSSGSTAAGGKGSGGNGHLFSVDASVSALDGDYYTKGFVNNGTAKSGSGDKRFYLGSVETRTHEAPCEPGHYCVGGVRFPCPRGVFGSALALQHPSCSGLCAPGFVCPERSTDSSGGSTSSHLGATPRPSQPCGLFFDLEHHDSTTPLSKQQQFSGVFCPRGSRWPQPAFKGYFTVGGTEATRSDERRCPPGSYCVRGVKTPCKAGFYGDAFGLTDPKCSGLCAAGFYCPVGSAKAEEFPCGDPGQYCPEGSKLPTMADAGRYTVNGVCLDRWPPSLRTETAFSRDGNLVKGKKEVFSAAELETLLNLFHNDNEYDPSNRNRGSGGSGGGGTSARSQERDADFARDGGGEVRVGRLWSVGQKWTLQVVASSTCRHALRFGFGFGSGSLVVTVPGNAADATVRAVGTGHANFRDPASTTFRAFDRCEPEEALETAGGSSVSNSSSSPNNPNNPNNGSAFDEAEKEARLTLEHGEAFTVTFHEVRLGHGDGCPGFAAPPVGACVEASWSVHTAFDTANNQEAFRSESTTEPRNSVVRYLARSVSVQGPGEAGVAPVLRPENGFAMPGGEASVPPDLLQGREWRPCDFTGEHDGGGSNVVTPATSESLGQRGMGSTRSLSADGVAGFGRRLLYDDGPVAVWVSGEPVWWRHKYKLNTHGDGGGGGGGGGGNFGSDDGHRATPTLTIQHSNPSLAVSLPSAAYSSSPWSTYTTAGSSSSSSSSSSGEDLEGYPSSLLRQGERYVDNAPPGWGRGIAAAAAKRLVPGATSTGGAGRAVGGVARRTWQALAPRGHYAVRGLLYECPAGQFGATEGLVEPQCSGACERGHYCPPASVHPRQFPCGHANRICPAGSPHPLPVSEGYYTSAHTETEACPPGLWRQVRLVDPAVADSAKGPRNFTSGYHSEWLDPELASKASGDGAGLGAHGPTKGAPDNWALGSLAPCVPCPQGTFKAVTGESALLCVPCDLAVSVSSRDRTTCECFRAAGGGHPTAASNTSGSSRDSGIRDSGGFGFAGMEGGAGSSSSAVTLEASSSFVAAFISRHGRRPTLLELEAWHRETHGGSELGGSSRLGAGWGQRSFTALNQLVFVVNKGVQAAAAAAASGIGSSSGGGVGGTCVAVDGENKSTAVLPLSLRNSTWTRFLQFPCERGHWCAGDGVRRVCPAGRFGSSVLNTDPLCSGLCAPGYFCPEGSVVATQFVCGGADRFCPKGSPGPTMVALGHFTQEDRYPDIRSHQTACPQGFWCRGGVRTACPAGRWGGAEGQSSPECSGVCSAGHWCPKASTTPTANQCGNASVYCPPGASSPSPVIPKGYYTTHAAPYRGALSLHDPLNATMSAQLVCEPGHWCRGGVKRQCAAGRFGWRHGEGSAECGELCRAGHRCPGHPGPPSLTATPLECSEGLAGAAVAAAQQLASSTFFCPEGTGNEPKRVASGFYTVGGKEGNTTRTNEVKCEAGYWCSGGVKEPCPVGSFGRKRGLTSPRCSGFCPAGFACPEASVEPSRCLPGSYSTGIAKKCTRCPRGSGGRDTAYSSEKRQQACVDKRSCCGF